jgi:hypothetical protein
MTNIVEIEDGKLRLHDVTLVAVEYYGSEGLMPIYRKDCPMKDDGGDVSCVGSSGENCCGSFLGTANTHVVMCGGG